MSVIMSERLKQLRKEKGKKQHEAAKDMFMSRTTLAKYENPDTDLDSMRAKELLILADYYNCDPRYITGDISCKDKEASDIHDLTALTEDAIVSLMQRKADAYKYGISFDTYNQLLLANIISHVITHFDDNLLIEYVESSACCEIGSEIIADAKANEYKIKEIDDPLTKIIQSKMFHEKSARCAKIDLGNKFMNDLDEWIKGIVDEYTAMLLEKSDHYRK